MSQTPARVSFTYDVYVEGIYAGTFTTYVIPDRNQSVESNIVPDADDLEFDGDFVSLPTPPSSPWNIGGSLTEADLDGIDPEEFFNTPLTQPAPWLPVQNLFAQDEILPTQVLSDSDREDPEILFKDTTGDINLSDLFE